MATKFGHVFFGLVSDRREIELPTKLCKRELVFFSVFICLKHLFKSTLFLLSYFWLRMKISIIMSILTLRF